MGLELNHIQSNSKIATKYFLVIYAAILGAQQILSYFPTLPFLCSWTDSHLRVCFFLLLSLCKQITRIRENMISIFLCLYLHYGACVGSANEVQRQVESLIIFFFFLFFFPPRTPHLFPVVATLRAASIIPLAGN